MREGLERHLWHALLIHYSRLPHTILTPLDLLLPTWLLSRAGATSDEQTAFLCQRSCLIRKSLVALISPRRPAAAQQPRRPAARPASATGLRK